MRKLILAGAAAFVAALALTMAAPPMAVAQAAAPPADTAAPAPDPAKVALVKRYFAAIHMSTLMSGMMHQMVPVMAAQMRKTHPEMTDAQVQDVSDAVTGSMDDFMSKLAVEMTPAFAETFSTDELTKLDEFYESPVGQSILAKMPMVMQKVTPAMMQMMPQMQADMMKRMCAKMDCSAPKSDAAVK
jgi:hypothetical protein